MHRVKHLTTGNTDMSILVPSSEFLIRGITQYRDWLCMQCKLSVMQSIANSSVVKDSLYGLVHEPWPGHLVLVLCSHRQTRRISSPTPYKSTYLHSPSSPRRLLLALGLLLFLKKTS